MIANAIMPDKHRTIIVAGGAGFIGSNLCRALVLDRRNLVMCIDNFSTGLEKNISDLSHFDNFVFARRDISDKIPAWNDIDEIYNLACPASPVHYQADPVQTTKTSVLGSINLLELAKMSGARILQASTSEVYGDPLRHPQDESYWGNVNPIGIRSCYDEGKRCAESLFMDYHREYGVKAKIVRIFNTYGPGMSKDDGRVVSNFICQALRGDDITIYGDGSQTRSFQYIGDLIEGLVAMMDTEDNYIGPVNIGNPVEFTVSELAELVIRLTNSKSRIVNYDLPADDPTRRKPEISLAIRDLNWQPRISLEEGLIRTIDYFKKELYG